MTDARIDFGKTYPAGKRALAAFDRALADPGVDKTLGGLIKVRASQVNGCALCLDMHTKEARDAGETERRIYALNAWRETALFTEEERAVLALTEAVTLISDGHVPDEVFDEAKRHFDDETLSKIIMAIISINAWNRLGIVQRLPIGE
ncbi:MAG: carboxymuconolactone decarboxylase family protein [Pseudonocardiales bacterium]|nr:carboxymuconolactone decarboxylase family protein [Pseudonocardiales bacterium]